MDIFYIIETIVVIGGLILLFLFFLPIFVWAIPYGKQLGRIRKLERDLKRVKNMGKKKETYNKHISDQEIEYMGVLIEELRWEIDNE